MQLLRNFLLVVRNKHLHLVTEDDWSSNREYRTRQRKLTLSPGHFLVVRCLTSFSRAARGQQTSQRVPKCHGNKHQLRPSNLRQVFGLNGVTADQSCFDIPLPPPLVHLSSLVETPCDTRSYATNSSDSPGVNLPDS